MHMKLERFSISQRAIDLFGSAFAGLCTGGVVGWSRSSGDLYSSDFIECTLIGTASYLLAGLFLITKNGKTIFRVPGWVLTPILGSIISFVGCVLLPNEMADWRHSRAGSFA